MENKSVFETLNPINVNEKVEKKNGLSYLSWCYAWSEVKKIYPDAHYEIKRFENGLPYVYDEKTGYMVFTEVTIEGITHEMWLPVMDGANKAMMGEPYTISTKYGDKTVERATMFDINKTIMRCLVKNLAMFGLGLYIYAGEDLPEQQEEPAKKISKEQVDGLAAVLTSSGFDDERINKMLKYYKVDKIDNLDEKQYADLLTKIKKEQKK